MALSKRKLLFLEQQAAKQAKTLSVKQKTNLNNILRRIESKLDEVIVTSNAPGNALISMKRIELTNLIRSEFGALTALQERELDFLLEKVYNNSRVEISKDLGSQFNVVNEFQARKLMTDTIDGKTYSQRLYKNNTVIAERINNDISRMLYQKAEPNEIKKLLMKDFGISYNSADRLIRTETSKFFNSAAEDSYKAAGITEIEWLTEKDDRTCEICGPLDKQRFPIGTKNAPAHVSCRCTILPVIED